MPFAPTAIERLVFIEIVVKEPTLEGVVYRSHRFEVLLSEK